MIEVMFLSLQPDTSASNVVGETVYQIPFSSKSYALIYTLLHSTAMIANNVLNFLIVSLFMLSYYQLHP